MDKEVSYLHLLLSFDLFGIWQKFFSYNILQKTFEWK
jgi:hypothetical protein